MVNGFELSRHITVGDTAVMCLVNAIEMAARRNVCLQGDGCGLVVWMILSFDRLGAGPDTVTTTEQGNARSQLAFLEQIWVEATQRTRSSF